MGLVAGFFTCYGTTNIPSSLSWRLPFVLLAAYSFVFSTAALIFLPASPRWLTLRGRTEEATAAWEKLGVPAADREKIMLDQTQDVAMTDNNPNSSGSSPDRAFVGVLEAERLPKSKNISWSEVFSPEARPRLFMAIFLMGMQQLSGIDGVLYVSSYRPGQINSQS
jgi:hypothetical protein